MGDNKIECVSEYTYLGVKFSRLSLFLSAYNHFQGSARMAINSTARIVRQTQLYSWDKIRYLFDSLVKSVLCYNAEVWSLPFLEKLDKIQTAYYKIILSLPVNTPNHAIRMESHSISLKLVLFTKILKWLSKLNAMNDNRYPKICYKALIQQAFASPSIKNNWIRQIEKLFNLIGIELSEPFLLSINFKSIPALTDQLHILLSNQDHERVINSNALLIYPSLLSKSGIVNAPYLCNEIKLDQKHLLCQLRLITSHSNYLTVYNTRYYFDNTAPCKYCGPNENDDICHYITECPRFSTERQILLDLFNDDSPARWLNILECDEKHILIGMCNFIKSICVANKWILFVNKACIYPRFFKSTLYCTTYCFKTFYEFYFSLFLTICTPLTDA